MAANNYYEKTEPVVEEPKEDNDEDSRLERVLEWLFSRFEILQSDNTLRLVYHNIIAFALTCHQRCWGKSSRNEEDADEPDWQSRLCMYYL